MRVTIRIAGPDDSAAVRSVLEDSYPALMADAYPAELLARALPLIVRPHPRLLAGGTYFLAEADERDSLPHAPDAEVRLGRHGDRIVVGCGGWSFWMPGIAEQPALAHIRHFAVRSFWAGRGVGRALYERCERDARAAGASRFEVQSSLNGEAFYAALGFVRFGPIKVPMGPGLEFPSILMRRDI